MLQALLKERRDDDRQPLFPGNRNGRLSRDTVARIVRKHVTLASPSCPSTQGPRQRMDAAGIEAERADIRRDLDALIETEIERDGRRFFDRSTTRGNIDAILRCAGARLSQTIRQIATDEQEASQTAE